MIKWTIDDREVMGVLRRLAATGADMSLVMADIAQVLASESERQFEAQAGPLGPWPDLAESTKAARARRGKWPGQMLQVSSAGLAASVQTDYDSRSASIGTNKPYGAIHQLGGQAGRGGRSRIKARPYLPAHPETGELTPEARDTIMEILRDRLARALGG